MSCTKCKTIPQYDFFNVKAYISITADHLVYRLEKMLDSLKYPYSNQGQFHIAEIPNFELWLYEMWEGEFFDPLEAKEIYILPMSGIEPVSFGHFSLTKPLSFWTSLIQNKDLLFVLEEHSLKTVFQPIVRASDFSLFGYEGLTRGINPDGLLLSPTKLFSGAKTLDLLFNLDRQCRESVIARAAERQLEGKLFLNFVPTAIYDPDECLKSTAEAVTASGLNPENIVFEVVESERVEDYSHLKKILRYYKEQGYQTALDDVGSGFSTIEAYHALGTEYVKIDMNIIRNIHHNSGNQAFLDRIMQLKHRYGVKILAEGVEYEPECQYLVANGVDYLQGYYFGKPE